MGKKLAIKGHATRGKEVIELLEMMGGNNIIKLDGNTSCAYYVIEGFEREIRIGEYIFGDEDICFFTLEEFLEKYPFKVRDFVRIPEYELELCILKMKWCPLSEHIEYMVCPNDEEEWFTANELLEYNDNPSPSEITQSERMIERNNTTNHMQNVLSELLDHIKNTSKEELEKEFNELEEWSNVGPTVEEFMDFCNKVNKKPKYPTTYEECCKVFDFCGDYFLTTYDAECMVKKEVYGILQQVNSLMRLLICRDAYWKIAGKEMGLDKSWESPLPSLFETVYCIRRKNNKIIKGSYRGGKSEILEFPIEEMRDAFHENFKDLIEQCKELL